MGYTSPPPAALVASSRNTVLVRVPLLFESAATPRSLSHNLWSSEWLCTTHKTEHSQYILILTRPYARRCVATVEYTEHARNRRDKLLNCTESKHTNTNIETCIVHHMCYRIVLRNSGDIVYRSDRVTTRTQTCIGWLCIYRTAKVTGASRAQMCVRAA